MMSKSTKSLEKLLEFLIRTQYYFIVQQLDKIVNKFLLYQLKRILGIFFFCEI